MYLNTHRKNFAFNIHHQNSVLVLVVLQFEVSVSFWHLPGKIENPENFKSE
jgi:hypothetical protein